MMAQHDGGGGGGGDNREYWTETEEWDAERSCSCTEPGCEPSNFRRTFALQAARGLGVSYSEGKADPSHEA